MLIVCFTHFPYTGVGVSQDRWKGRFRADRIISDATAGLPIRRELFGLAQGCQGHSGLAQGCQGQTNEKGVRHSIGPPRVYRRLLGRRPVD